MIPKRITEQSLEDMFAPHGDVKNVFIIRNPNGTPKGCAFVRMETKEGAEQKERAAGPRRFTPPGLFLACYFLLRCLASAR